MSLPLFLLDAFFVAMGAWTLLAWAVAFGGGSFACLAGLAWLVPAATLAFFACFGRGPRSGARVPAAGDEDLSPARAGAAVAAATLAVSAYAWSQSYALLCAAALAVFVAALVVDARAARAAQARAALASGVRTERGAAWRRADVLALALAWAAALAVTLVAIRPDPDDAFYVGLMAGALDRPEDALLGADTMYGDAGLPLLDPWYRLKSYEPLIAAISYLTGADYKELYYVAAPALMATLAVFATFAALRALGGAGAGIGTLAVVVALVAWGRGPETFGNFAFVRLYQCKPIVVAVCVPAAVAYAAAFALRPSARSWMLLALCQVAALGIAGSAVVAVPTTAAALVAGAAAASRLLGRTAIPTERERAGSRLALPGLAASLLVAAVALAMLASMRWEQASLPSWQEIAAYPALAEESLARVLGRPPQATVALFGFVAAPLLAPRATRPLLLGYAIVLVLAVLDPLVPGLVGRIAGRLTWRVLWTVPFPLFLGLAVQRLAGLPPIPRIGRAAGLVAGAALVAAFVGGGDASTLHRANGVEIGAPGLKVPSWHRHAEAVVALSQPSDLVLVPAHVAAWLPTFRGHPRLVGVRDMYWGILGSRRAIEVDARRELFATVGRSDDLDSEQVFATARKIPALGVRLVVTWNKRVSADLGAALEAVGCKRLATDDAAVAVLRQGGYTTWRCGYPHPPRDPMPDPTRPRGASS